MAITVSFNNEDYPEGHEFEIRGLGVIPNGGSITLESEDEARFIRETHTTVTDALKDSVLMKVSGTATIQTVKDVLGIDPEDLQKEAAAPVQQVEQVEQVTKPTANATLGKGNTATGDGEVND